MKKRIVSLLMAAILLLLLPVTPSAATPQFTDIQNHWAKDYILSFANKGFVKGYPDQTFKPDRPISRAEFTSILLNCLGITPASDVNTPTFSDTTNHWARAQIAEAVRRGILVVSEYPGGLKPDDPIYRSEAAAMMIRALGKSPDMTPTSFKDSNQIAKSMYRGYIKAASSEGLMHGYPDGTFRPFQGVKRGEACAMLVNLLGKIGTASPPAVQVNPSSNSALSAVVIQGNHYKLGDTVVYLKRDSTNIPIYSLSVAGGLVFINNTFTYPLNSTDNNPDLVVNNTRYVQCRLSVSGSDLQVTPGAVKLDSISYNGYKYNADYVKLYIGNKNGSYYLSDAELVDRQTVRVGGNSYDISSTPVSIALGDNFYAINGINYDSSGISLDLAATTPVVMNGLDISDISAIFVDTRSLDLNTISSLFFIIDGSRYDRSEVVIDASGNFTANNKYYTPDQVTMVINNSFYKLTDVKSFGGKFIFYCTASNVTTWAIVNGKYQDASTIQILVGNNIYTLDKILVVQHNVIRIGGRQYKLGDIFGCRINGTLYDIEDINYDNSLDLVTMDVTESTGSWTGYLPGQPQKYLFYVDNSIYQDGATGDVTIYAGGGWRTFDSITFSDQSHFVYDNTTYNLLGAEIKIGDTVFTVVDSAWRVSSQVMEVYLQKA
ncbi:hypothetical protein MTAT_18330 [Moorella thermoacetica]|uniref:Cellulosome-anchoring protein n=2 Tax=Neomoorella thermoacetica TaxID=1525 RepID=A0AAC9HG16_NEOTH|nr:S-layer homology domain-containing protein [Moorella thermoacetica]AOQ23301.1 Cellulosome-anchoring protein precursor [Moorella thermoacetica]TYL13007.1 hypothetical protein MTAT_18330 [Moorella thermoacetica]